MKKFTIIILLAICNLSHAEGFLSEYYENFDQGRWKLEISTTRLGQADQYIENKEDTQLVSNIDYEWPLDGNQTLSLRIIPMLYYYIDNDRLTGRESVDIYSVGAGLAWKMYENPTHDGIFLDLGAAPIWNSDDFPGNSARFNFLLNVGLGYQFENGWSTAIKYYHISNANLGDRNRGVDTFALTAGYRF